MVLPNFFVWRIGLDSLISGVIGKRVPLTGRIAKSSCVLALIACLISCQGMVNKGAVINGQKYYDRGDYDKALSQLRLAESDNIEAQLLMARTYEAKGDRGLAKAHYTELADKHPDTAEGVYSEAKLKNF